MKWSYLVTMMRGLFFPYFFLSGILGFLVCLSEIGNLDYLFSVLLHFNHFSFQLKPFYCRKRQLQAEHEKAEMPNFGPTIIPEPDPTPPSTPIGMPSMRI